MDAKPVRRCPAGMRFAFRLSVREGLTRQSYWPVFAVAVVLAACRQAPPAIEVDWKHSLALGMEAAAARETDMVLFFNAPWCEICRRMKVEVFTSPQVSRVLGGRIPVWIDIEQWPHVAEKYGVEAVPAIFVLTSTGDMRDFIIGGLDTEQVTEFLSRTASAPLGEPE